MNEDGIFREGGDAVVEPGVNVFEGKTFLFQDAFKFGDLFRGGPFGGPVGGLPFEELPHFEDLGVIRAAEQIHGGGGRFGRDLLDEGPDAGTRLDDAGIGQCLQDFADAGTADLKHLGQRDFPGQFAAGFPLPALDGGGDLLHDLAVEVDSAYRLEGVGHRGS